MEKTTKFHGMTVISDYDQTTVKGRDVIEVNSNNDLVCCYYDYDGIEEDNPMVIDIFQVFTSKYPRKLSESNITGYIKRCVGQKSLLISESAVDYIQSHVA